MCSSMKQPKPERLVEMLGMPITVHSAAGRREKKPTELSFPCEPAENSLEASTAPSAGASAKRRALC